MSRSAATVPRDKQFIKKGSRNASTAPSTADAYSYMNKVRRLLNLPIKVLTVYDALLVSDRVFDRISGGT
jgi:hypothetical protein